MRISDWSSDVCSSDLADMDRFTMAETLVARARKHANWIGDDHGDPYEVAMLAGEVGTEMQVTAKEILDHLRAALAYFARHVWQQISAAPAGPRIFFPFRREKTRKRVGGG